MLLFILKLLTFIICQLNPNEHNLTGRSIASSPFVVQSFICGGAFGLVYTGLNKKTNEKVAVKLEPLDADKAQLYLEFGFYNILNNCPFTPMIHFFGQCSNYNALVLDLLGPSLKEMFKKMGQSFSLKTVAALGVSLMEIMDYFHSHGLIYRDVKPENFLLGQPNTPRAMVVHIIGRFSFVQCILLTVLCLDMGLCKEWKTEKGVHIPFQRGKCVVGTLMFISSNMHSGFELSRRDDIEAIMYMLIYLHKGTLPWAEFIKLDVASQVLKIGEMKHNIPPATLCSKMGKEFETIMESVRDLAFAEQPNYNQYLELFKRVLDRQRVSMDDFCSAYDWFPIHNYYPKSS